MNNISFKPSLSTFFVIFFFIHSHAQSVSADECIKAWSATGSKQPYYSWVINFDLFNRPDSVKYIRLIQELEKKIDQKKSTRLAVRLFMYKGLDYMLSGKKGFPESSPQFSSESFKRNILITQKLADEFLLAEVYAMYAEICYRENRIQESLVYSIKAIEIIKKKGVQYFPNTNALYMSTAVALYHTEDYKQSLQYSLQCRYDTVKEHNKPPYAGVFQNNIMGAAYEKLKMYDSAIYYYERIFPFLNKEKKGDPGWLPFWITMVNGDIARARFLKDRNFDPSEALNAAINTSLSYGEMSNVATFMNNKAAVDWHHRRTGNAINLWHQVLSLSYPNANTSSMEAAKGLANIYKYLNNADSVYFYYSIYKTLDSSHMDKIRSWQLTAAQAKVNLEQLEQEYEQSKQKLYHQTTVRNLILLSVVVLAILGLILYNRKAMKHRYEASILKQKRINAEQEITAAKHQIENFKQWIIEKDKLIESLELGKKNESNEEKSVDFAHYTILTEEQWDNFKKDFSIAYPGFFQRLHQKIPNLTPAMERLSTFLFLRLDNKQIASCLGISADSVARGKRRLRVLLNISHETNVEDFIAKI